MAEEQTSMEEAQSHHGLGRDAAAIRYPCRSAQTSPDPDVLNARGCVVADADTRKLVERLPDRASGVGLSGHASPAFAPHMLNLQEALADDWFAVALVELSGRVGNETLDGERAVLVLRVQDGRFVEFWSHHYDQQKMNRAWS